MIEITPDIMLDERELQESFIRASGPGGQNVNKVETAVQLRFDVRNSPSLPEPVRERLLRLGGQHLTDDGVLVIKAMRFRTQAANREDAVTRLVELIQRAVRPPRPRHATRPTLASRQRRLDTKRRQGTIKAGRRTPPEE
jgi:ribosome-associated protein